MILSVCIPVFNYDVSDLVNSLNEEILGKKLDAEIILIDDFSEPYFKLLNRILENEVSKYIELSENLGRSKIRNLFTKHSAAEYLLFLDCDSKIISDDFLEMYLNFCSNENPQVVYGGFNEMSVPGSLRAKYSREREIQTVSDRSKKPYDTLKGINFLVKKEILTAFPFDEEITDYGYEDYLFAQKLRKNYVQVAHIDNPVLHEDQTSNADFLMKVKISIDTLSMLLQNSKFEDDFSSMKLIKAMDFIKKFGLKSLFLKWFRKNKNNLERKLLSGETNLRLLDFYKLGLLLERMK